MKRNISFKRNEYNDEGLLMDTKNNIESEKLTVDEKTTINNPNPDAKEQGSTLKGNYQEISIEEDPMDELLEEVATESTEESETEATVRAGVKVEETAAYEIISVEDSAAEVPSEEATTAEINAENPEVVPNLNITQTDDETGKDKAESQTAESVAAKKNSDLKVNAEPSALEPEATAPVTSEPEATEPSASEPEATEPSASEPEAAEPVTSEPEAAEPSALIKTSSEEKTKGDETDIDYVLEDGVEEEESEDEDDDVDENTVSEDSGISLLPIDEIVQHLRDLLNSENPKRKDVDEYKNQFYRSLRNEIEAQKQIFMSEGGEEIDFVAKESEIFIEGKDLLQKIKEKRAAILAKEEKEKEKNVARKLAIIEQIKVLTENQGQEDFNKIYQEFKNLQQEWSEIKLVPQSKVNELWRSYQRYVEKFYDLVRINNEFREYDFKKNLELKTELCEAAERLDDEKDVISAFHQLQNLHQEWREIGPVSRKERELIWDRFKEASTNINKKYQAHFEELRGKETENLELKTALCEKLEAIDYSQFKTIKDWNNKVKEVLEIQSQWRQIGFVPRKWNTKIYKRYRAACDMFFKSKNNFYKSLRGEMEENLKKKTILCERAEEMKDSRDWKKTTQDMIEIQKEWKSIGIVPYKYVDSIWKRFITACDYFFEQKKLHTSSQYEEETRNLEAKRAVVKTINNLDNSLSVDKALEELRELMDEWYSIGHVPYKIKDRIYREFYEATEAQFDRLNIDKAERKLESFKTNISDMAKSGNAKGQLLRERDRLMRQYERMKGELQTYENNIGFLSVSSKKGNHLLDDMNQKMEKIKSELQLIVKKIGAIDAEL